MPDAKKQAQKVLPLLKQSYANADCALVHGNPFQLLIATILSAQCTDKRVNEVTKALFRKYKTARGFAASGTADLENMIRSTGFFRQKARWIRSCSSDIVHKFGGRVPGTMEELLSLAGVARKTANVVLGTAFRQPAGIVVDTHVRRVSNRLGLTRQRDPVKIERDLQQIIPQRDWIWFSHALIAHGRQTCRAPVPRCDSCPLNRICPSSRVRTAG